MMIDGTLIHETHIKGDFEWACRSMPDEYLKQLEEIKARIYTAEKRKKE